MTAAAASVAGPSYSASASAAAPPADGAPKPRPPQQEKQPDPFRDLPPFSYETFDPDVQPTMVLANTREIADEWLPKLKK